jgi:hypothetical protein
MSSILCSWPFGDGGAPPWTRLSVGTFTSLSDFFELSLCGHKKTVLV